VSFCQKRPNSFPLLLFDQVYTAAPDGPRISTASEKEMPKIGEENSPAERSFRVINRGKEVLIQRIRTISRIQFGLNLFFPFRKKLIEATVNKVAISRAI